jgi:DNA-binding response OmpR family regulator
MTHVKIPILVAEIPAIRSMIAVALEQQGFAPACCEPGEAEAELRKGKYRVLVTNAPVHLRSDQIPTVYLAADCMEFPQNLPPQSRVVAKPFGVDQLLDAIRMLLMVNPAGRRRPAERRFHASR